MDSRGFREAAISSIDEIIKYYDNITSRDVVSSVSPGYLRQLLPSSAPETPESWDDIQRDIEGKIMPGITHWQHPSFHAFFPCATSYPSILGELYSSALSGACFNWICSPAVTELETIVLDWLGQLLGLPECYLSTGSTRGGGVIQGSASEAVLTAMVAARDKYLRNTLPTPPAEEEDLLKGGLGTLGNAEGEEYEELLARKRSRMVALGTTATHSSTKKAAVILGVRFYAIPVGAKDGYRLTGEVLKKALGELKKRGLEPFFLTATLGTTDTCAVDDFAAIADTLEEFTGGEEMNGDIQGDGGGKGEVWVHVDAAYAGSALVCPEFRGGITEVLGRFHSFNMNMHKWLLTNFDASCLFVRDRNWFIQALSVNQAVYGNAASAGGLVTDYREWQIPLGRRFRALKIWFVLRSYGGAGLREYIHKTVKLGEEFAEMLKGRGGLFEILTGPSFALVVFALRGKTPEEGNVRTKELCERVNKSGKMWVTGTTLDGRFAIRFMTGVRTTEKEHVEMAFKMLVEVAEDITQGA
ncbi:pyridoxal phosphate-dependent transferase [Diplogelasinospora grovesii]|uniref:Pyridoxal phosphate-dependent transferase n=1 Tax=Diplogelasinospora grovesii TaxID=303347 RepID=A0AAN6NDJ3_9PEZI|nr:pyridoxal phosphate-dependent transferase [Diplogelasinospora grovesii]